VLEVIARSVQQSDHTWTCVEEIAALLHSLLIARSKIFTPRRRSGDNGREGGAPG
jgi:hypothetical protein